MQYGTVNSLKSPRFAGVRTFMRMQQVRTTEDIDFAVGLASEFLGHSNTATRSTPDNNHVNIGTGAHQVVVPHKTAYHVGLHSATVGNSTDFAEERVGEGTVSVGHGQRFGVFEGRGGQCFRARGIALRR